MLARLPHQESLSATLGKLAEEEAAEAERMGAATGAAAQKAARERALAYTAQARVSARGARGCMHATAGNGAQLG